MITFFWSVPFDMHEKKYKNFGKKPSKSNKDVNDEFVLKKIVLFEINK